MEHVVQLDTKPRTLPGLDILLYGFQETGNLRKDGRTGVARLSSARAVRRTLKWDNERNPYVLLYQTG